MSGNGSLQASPDVADALALGGAPSGIGTGGWVIAEPGTAILHDRVPETHRTVCIGTGWRRCRRTVTAARADGLSSVADSS